MSTQLRLIAKADTVTDAPARPLRGRVATARDARQPARRRAVHWQGQWRLDQQTREVGKAGVASARAALAAAHREDRGEDPAESAPGLRQAS